MARTRPLAYSRNVSRVWPAVSSISSCQTGTNPTSSSQARRLRALVAQREPPRDRELPERRPAGTRTGTSLIDSFVVLPGGHLLAARGSPFTGQGLGQLGAEFSPARPWQ